MDIALAQTFLMVAETGSFIDAARKLNVTQSTVSARIRSLEELFGRPLFERSKNGASLTGAGEQFQKHALALVRVWQDAQLEVGFSGPYRDHLAVGARATLWDGFLMRWISWLRDNIPDIAISASASLSAVMIQRLLEGTLDLAVMYRPGQPPGLTIEHLFDEEFVLVTSAPARSRRTESNYVFVDRGPDFQADHAAAYPKADQHRRSIWIWARWGSISSSPTGFRLLPAAARQAPRQPASPAHSGAGALFGSPVYMVYPEARDEEPTSRSCRACGAPPSG
jgi:DNA-binding transcriptional LysR family regulator